MHARVFSLLIAVFIVVGLFVVLFLQGAYVRHRLADIERAKLSEFDADMQCPEIDNGLRSYALLVACCKTRELNASPRLPKSITSGDTSLDVSIRNSARWLALMNTTAATQLRRDIVSGRVKYIVLGGHVARVSIPNMHEYFTEGELAILNNTFVMLSVMNAFLPGDTVVMPWNHLEQKDGGGVRADDIVSRACGEAGSRCSEKILAHVWGYGVSSSAVSADADP